MPSLSRSNGYRCLSIYIRVCTIAYKHLCLLCCILSNMHRTFPILHYVCVTDTAHPILSHSTFVKVSFKFQNSQSFSLVVFKNLPVNVQKITYKVFLICGVRNSWTNMIFIFCRYQNCCQISKFTSLRLVI